jgi:hypothetical protein
MILTAPNPAVVPVYNFIDMEHRLVREVHLAEEIRLTCQFFLACPQRSLHTREQGMEKKLYEFSFPMT